MCSVSDAMKTAGTTFEWRWFEDAITRQGARV